MTVFVAAVPTYLKLPVDPTATKSQAYSTTGRRRRRRWSDDPAAFRT
ncbi:MAG: hypothetical protein M5T61_20305 [Acidimicrobiia bacterium]|nr:hypothetical protein [Acidimicrobiia bacterium]